MQNRTLRGLLLLGVIFCCLPLLAATKGVVLIDQAGALAGGISGACDAPGFPVTICKSGSYRLTSDLSVPAGVNGINIAADDVTLDLNGFTISGTGSCSGNGSFLSCSGSTGGFGIHGTHNNTTIRNGSVRGFGGFDSSGALSGGGIHLTGVGSIVEEVHASENALGIDIIWGVVTQCTVDRNLNGLQAFFSQLKGNSASNNRFDGFFVENSGIMQSAANNNGGWGFVGIASLVSEDQAMLNQAGDLSVGLNSPGNNSCSGSLC